MTPSDLNILHKELCVGSVAWLQPKLCCPIYIELYWFHGILYIYMSLFEDYSYFIAFEKSTFLLFALAFDFFLWVAQFQLKIDILEVLACIVTENF
jgi:hypothetical protein